MMLRRFTAVLAPRFYMLSSMRFPLQWAILATDSLNAQYPHYGSPPPNFVDQCATPNNKPTVFRRSFNFNHPVLVLFYYKGCTT